MFSAALRLAGTLFLPFFAEAGSIVADYRTIPDGIYPLISFAGTTVTGSSSIDSALFAGFRGLGITGAGSLGGGSDQSLDAGETMTIDFGQLVTNTTAMINDIDPVGNVTFGLTAFRGTMNLGDFMFPAAAVQEQVYNVSALAGNQPITRFTICVQSPSAPLGLQVQGVSYDAVPEPATGFISGAAIIAAYFMRRRFQQLAASTT